MTFKFRRSLPLSSQFFIIFSHIWTILTSCMASLTDLAGAKVGTSIAGASLELGWSPPLTEAFVLTENSVELDDFLLRLNLLRKNCPFPEIKPVIGVLVKFRNHGNHIRNSPLERLLLVDNDCSVETHKNARDDS
ncbi:Os04g0449700 [Oryza sativa Japonica Group]|uniref:Os04g0449700 protein n=1 Tax=Oryza sativa subsp. japonica TaxID=39947 RepID=A0A0P0WAZ4_ORYSJ|nr:hypothetical protein EE612_023633 [Oryza sativa]BAS89445.1 Os04g0449700 [Oryza sativa Japonica Group]